MKISAISLHALDPYFGKLEALTTAQRLLISLGTVVLIVGAFVYFSFLPKYEKIDKLDKELTDLSKKLEDMKREAAQLSKYRKMMNDAEEDFKLVRKALPEKKEIPDLLTSISQSGHDAGLEFLLFEPKKETMKDFFTEIPVSVIVSGNYHNLGLFLSKVASLPRVVNVRDLSLKPEKGGAALTTSCTAVTYRFIEKETENQSKPNKKKK